MIPKIIFSLAILLCLSSCWLIFDNKDCPAEYRFTIPFEVVPMEDTISVGDTLWVSSFFEDVLTEKASGDTHLFDKNNFYSEFVLFQMDTMPIQQAEGFSYLTTIGRRDIVPLHGGIYTNLITPVYENGEYKFKIALIPSQKGLYYLTFTSVLSPDTKYGLPCTYTPVYLDYDTNNGADNHFYLIESSMDTTVKKTTLDEFNRYGCYCFVVK